MSTTCYGQDGAAAATAVGGYVPGSGVLRSQDRPTCPASLSHVLLSLLIEGTARWIVPVYFVNFDGLFRWRRLQFLPQTKGTQQHSKRLYHIPNINERNTV